MREIVIVRLLPLVLCLVPALAALVVAAAVPEQARDFYLGQVRKSGIDMLILGLGLPMFALQLLLAWRALQWRAARFDERPDRWLGYLAQAAEWFPLLGLLGTVASILETFSTIKGQMPPERIIEKYAPAITATGSGLFMALINILPSWLVLVGRDLILSLGGSRPGEEP